jgi:hypothetical protein
LPPEEKIEPEQSFPLELPPEARECVVQLYGQEMLDNLLQGQPVEIDQEAVRRCVEEKMSF